MRGPAGRPGPPGRPVRAGQGRDSRSPPATLTIAGGARGAGAPPPGGSSTRRAGPRRLRPCSTRPPFELGEEAPGASLEPGVARLALGRHRLGHGGDGQQGRHRGHPELRERHAQLHGRAHAAEAPRGVGADAARKPEPLLQVVVEQVLERRRGGRGCTRPKPRPPRRRPGSSAPSAPWARAPRRAGAPCTSGRAAAGGAPGDRPGAPGGPSPSPPPPGAGRARSRRGPRAPSRTPRARSWARRGTGGTGARRSWAYLRHGARARRARGRRVRGAAWVEARRGGQRSPPACPEHGRHGSRRPARAWRGLARGGSPRGVRYAGLRIRHAPRART